MILNFVKLIPNPNHINYHRKFFFLVESQYESSLTNQKIEFLRQKKGNMLNVNLLRDKVLIVTEKLKKNKVFFLKLKP